MVEYVAAMLPVAQTSKSGLITLSVSEHNNDSTLGVNVVMTKQKHTNFCSYVYCRVCMLGNRTLVRDRFDVCAKTVAMGNITVPSQLWERFCVPGNMSGTQCDDYFLQNNLTEIQGIPGLGSGIIRGKLIFR